MENNHTCPECGAPLPPDAPRGLCPACLLKRGLETHTMGATAAGTSARWEVPSAARLAALFPELEILNLIGRGGMGVVYRARQKNLDRLVALKILPEELGTDADFAERFAREAQAMARLNHPHIVAIHEFGRRMSPPQNAEPRGETGLYFFLMEFVDGMNLRQLLESGHVSPKEALAIVPQICEALQYAHDHGIVHRDIKPENILLNRQGAVKIADFGLAKLISPGARPRDEKVMGTAQYMAPEQRDRPGEVDHRADIYSLGVVFYQLLTGELPKGEFVPPSKRVVVDVRLDEIVLRALEQSPELRFQNATELKTQVETVINSVTVRMPIVVPAQQVAVAAPGAGLGAAFAAFKRRVRFSLVLVPLGMQTVLILLIYLIGGRRKELVEIFIPWWMMMLAGATATYSLFYFSLRSRRAFVPLFSALLLFLLAMPFVFGLMDARAGDPLGTFPIAVQVLFAALYVPLLVVAGLVQIVPAASAGVSKPKRPAFRPVSFFVALAMHGIALCGVLSFMLFYVPHMLEIYRDFKAQLPALTESVLAFSRLMQFHPFLLVPACLFVAALDAMILWALQQPKRSVYFWLWVVFVLGTQFLFLLLAVFSLLLPTLLMVDLIRS